MMKHTDVGVAALPPCFVHLHAGRRHPPDAIARLDSWLLHLINCIPFKNQMVDVIDSLVSYS